jgi:hypothetical protein
MHSWCDGDAAVWSHWSEGVRRSLRRNTNNIVTADLPPMVLLCLHLSTLVVVDVGMKQSGLFSVCLLDLLLCGIFIHSKSFVGIRHPVELRNCNDIRITTDTQGQFAETREILVCVRVSGKSRHDKGIASRSVCNKTHSATVTIVAS